MNALNQLMVNNRMEIDIPGIFVAVDVHHNSPMQIVTVVCDGTTAAMRMLKYVVVP